MPSLNQVLADAQSGEAIAELGQQYGLSPQRTKAAVAALLPAISMGLKRSMATPEGLGDFLALVGAQPGLHAMYNDPQAALSPSGRAAGNAVLSRMFGSPDASRAIADQAQQSSGISSTILKKLLPVIAGILISGLMRSGSGKAAPTTPQPLPDQGGGLIDILRQIFGQSSQDSAGGSPSHVPPITDILRPEGQASTKPEQLPAPSSQPGSAPTPLPPDTGQGGPGGDLLAQIMRELAKAIEDGRLKPVVVGPIEIGIPGQAGPNGQKQTPMGDIFGQILRDLLSGIGGQVKPATLTDGVGPAVFGDRLEPGHRVEQVQLEALQNVFRRYGS
jgi:hypothetical protein